MERSTCNTMYLPWTIMLTILAIFLATGTIAGSLPGQLNHLDKLVYERLVSSSSQEEFLRKLETYEVTYPESLGSQQTSRRIRRDTQPSDETVYKIDAFGKSYALVLHPNYDLIGQGVHVEYHNGNDSYQEKVSQSNCYKIGEVLGGKHSLAALSDCDGLAGAFQTDDGMVFIEPYENTTFSKTGKSGRAHLIYKQKLNAKSSHDERKKQMDAYEEPMASAQTGKVPASVVSLDAAGESGESDNKGKRTRRDSYDSFLTFINKAPRSVQLYWLDIFGHSVYFITLRPNEQKGINTFEDTKWIAMDEDSNIRLSLNNGTEFKASANEESTREKIVIMVPPNTKFPDKVERTVSIQGRDKYVETMVIADDSVVKHHGKDKVERFVLTLMNLASRIFKDQSLGVKINFIVTRLVILQKPDKKLQIIDKNPSRSVISACNYAFSLQEGSDRDAKHFDFAIILTRRPFGPSGYAPVYSMCTKSRSCTLVEDDGFTSAFIAAHETGHTLGLEHDGEANTCKSDGPKGSVMAPVVVSRFDRYYWSSCSRKAMQENLDYFKCLNDRPSQTMKYMKSLPGSYFTLDEQCEQNFGKGSQQCTAFRNNPCRMLWCTFPGKKRYCKTMRGPALDGSTCAKGKWCLKGDCVSNKITPKAPPTVVSTAQPPVDGQWSRWSGLTPCSVSCDIGVQHRTRSCNRPRPARGGKACNGESTQSTICNARKCPLTLSYNDVRTKQCEIKAGSDWKTYQDDDFNVALKRRQKNVNCSFDASMCDWKNVDREDQFDWQRRSGATPSRGTGPDQDHTKGNSQGSYMFIEASDDYQQRRRRGDKARLVSPVIIMPRACFRMFYHMHGDATGGLRVLMASTSRDDESSLLWEKKGKQGNKWLQAVIQVDYATPHKIIIEAVRGGHYTGDIAIDDVTLVSGHCDNSKEQNPCTQSCRTNSASQFKMDLVVSDGTKCYNNRSEDICLKGKCVKFGCDLKLGSRNIVDNCGICGGTGETCEKITNRKYFTPTRRYDLIAQLPLGSANIILQDGLVNGYHIGIRQRGSNSIYYGDTQNSESNYREIGGTTFHFKKSPDGKQTISSLGPTSMDLQAVLFSGRKRDDKAYVTYSFYQPKNRKTGVPEGVKYVVTGWTSCSASCGIGQQTSIIRCLRNNKDEVVNSSLCSGLTMPTKDVRSCNLQPCAAKYRWFALSWRQCSVSCGDGRQIRVVACIDSALVKVVSSRLCTDTPPVNVRACSRPKCPLYKWVPSQWAQCPVTCGGGLQSRTVECQDVTRKRTVPNHLCSEDKPEDTQPCGLDDCDSFAYTSTFGACSKSCGGGMRVRLVRCVNSRTGGIVEKKFCSGSAPPPIDTCNPSPCPEFIWRVSAYGRCSRTCGEGQQRRNVKCSNKATAELVDDRNCPETKPTATRTCIETKCPVYDWHTGGWSKCSKLCGKGTQSRAVKCISKDLNSVVAERYCKDKKPAASQHCTARNCSTNENINCGFEKSSFCSWKNDPRALFEWSIGKDTPSQGTGPSSGHNSEKFAYIEASSPRRNGDKAALLSPPINSAHGCLTLWYQMHGEGVGRLTVYYVGQTSRKALFQLNGKQGNVWKEVKIDIDKVGSENGYQILIIGERGQTFSSDIAIDDLSFKDTKCDPSEANNERKKEVVAASCKQISPLCLISHKKVYCKYRSYKILCCQTCANT